MRPSKREKEREREHTQHEKATIVMMASGNERHSNPQWFAFFVLDFPLLDCACFMRAQTMR
jgi:hypothetical protein